MSHLRTTVLALATSTLALISMVPASAGKDLKVHSSAVAVAKPMAVPKLQSWMQPEVGAAWNLGYRGQGTTITTVDDFTSNSGLYGNFGLGSQLLRHGQWTSLESSLIAPSASVVSKDFNTTTPVPLARGLNVLNLSYAMYAVAGYTPNQIGWSQKEASIISYATNGNAVISKAAGNDGIVVGKANSGGQVDYLDAALIGTKSAIFAGALNTNGTIQNKASLASYSNKAGTNTAVQSHFLVVGVEGSKTGLYGTSFAAPVISGYAAVVGSKFTTATPTQITNQLLTTARRDTLLNYNASTYGQGEASLSRALAPMSIR